MGFVYTDNGDNESAAALISNIPEHLIFGNATLLMIHGASLCNSETERGFSYLVKSMETAVKNKELDVAIKTQGFAISVCIQQNNFSGIKDIIEIVPMPQAIRANKQAWKMLIHSLFLKSATSYQVKLAKTLSRFIDKIGMKDQVELWQYSSLLSKSFLCGVIGDFGKADDLLLQLTSHPVALRNDRWLAFGLQLSGYLSNFMGKTDDLMQYADKMSSLGLKYADGFASSYGVHYTALAKYQSRDLPGAISTAKAAERLFIESRNPSMAMLANILQIAWQAEQNPDDGYASRIEEQLIPLTTASGNDGFIVAAKVLAGALYMKEGDLAKAEELLRQGWKWAKSKQALQYMCGIAMHLWALYHEKGKPRSAAGYLKFFGETAAQNKYVYFREMNFASLVSTCARCVENNIASSHMAAIIDKYFGLDAANFLLKAPSAIAADPDMFIQRFPSADVPKPRGVRIKLFGAFELAIEGKKADQELFKTRKISGIFKYILASPGKIVSREKLAAAFWPDSDGKAAQNSLRVALFELRKTLAALGMHLDSGKALIAESSDGFFVCRPEIIETDVSRFTALHEALRAGRPPGGDEIAALKELTTLYDGDFLEGVDTEDCAIERAHYMAVYVEASYKLVESYFNEGKTELTEELILKHLKIDPFDEKLCSILIELYQKTDRSRQASALKRQFTRYFEKEMGEKPEI
jgi:DNA-binding SARP family transcriptional activator